MKLHPTRKVSFFVLATMLLVYAFSVYSRLIFDVPNIILGESLQYDTYPIVVIFKSITNGAFPLWDNLVGGGTSAIGNPLYQQTYWLIYPLIFLFKSNFLFLMRMYFLSHLVLAALFFLLLTRYLKVSVIAGLAGSIVYISNQYVVTWTMQNGFRPDLVFTAWLPITFLFLLLTLERKKVIYAVFSGFAFSMFIHGGAAFNTLIAMILCCIFFGSYLVLRAWKRKNVLPDSLASIKLFIVFLVFAFLFSAIKLLPVLEFLDISSRQYSLIESQQGITLDWYITEIKRIFLTFLPGADLSVTFAKVFEIIHIVFLACIFLSLFSKHRRIVISLWVVTIASLWIGAGQAFKVDAYSFLYSIIPGFESIRFPSRFLANLYFTLPLLFVYGLDVIVGLRLGKRAYFAKLPEIITTIAVGCLMVVVAYSINTYTDNFPWEKYSKSDFDTLSFEIAQTDSEPWRVYSDLYGYKPSFYTFSLASDGGLDSLLNVYNDARPYYHDTYGTTLISEDNFSNWHRRWLIMNTKHLVYTQNSSSHETLLSVGVATGLVQEVFEYSPQRGVFDVIDTRPRIAYVPNGVLYISENKVADPYDIEEIRKLVFNPAFDLQNNTLFRLDMHSDSDYEIESLSDFDYLFLGDNISHDLVQSGQLASKFINAGGELLDIDNMPTNKPGEETYEILNVAETNGKVTVEIETSTPGFLVFSSTYYPGWEAELNGKKTPVFMADSYVKGVSLPSTGKQSLILEYRPKSFYLGVALTLAAVLFLVFLIISSKTTFRLTNKLSSSSLIKERFLSRRKTK